jgi:hypothetical protein
MQTYEALRPASYAPQKHEGNTRPFYTFPRRRVRVMIDLRFSNPVDGPVCPLLGSASSHPLSSWSWQCMNYVSVRGPLSG